MTQSLMARQAGVERPNRTILCPISNPSTTSSPEIVWHPTCLKPHLWPERDRQLWAAACSHGSITADGGEAAHLRVDSQRKIQKGYGVWLSFLIAQNWLQAEEAPAQRVTKARLAAYYAQMQALNRRPYSILGRFMELHMAMKAMAPDHNMGWILRPNGVSIRQMLNPAPRAMIIPDAKILFKWGLKLMDTARLDAPHRLGIVQFRDGLLIAMLAARGRRLRSMSLLCIGQEFVHCDAGYRIELKPAQVKTNKTDCFSLPTKLTPYIDRYLDSVRPALLGEQAHNALWVGINGEALSAKGIQHMICTRSKDRFGVSFGPHRFRHAIATTIPLRAPQTPGLAATLLGISKDTIEAHYDRASQITALELYHSILEG